MNNVKTNNEDAVQRDSQFWQSIFVQEKLAARMVEISALKEGLTFESEVYGLIRLQTSPATVLGDNFMSDAYFNIAILDDGTEKRAFVKVSDNMLLAMPRIFQLH